ncbi:hypothetical protein E2562_002726 [Oryza meyeriana var. granulata]|uniref:RING-type E3 ubiquitin transferase n=1 Tax=Oryza meyeriana var. granulata TaxID=110450 RepID=A0A6G1BPM6_9ORYZ|nr:hypothetical protein E2562_002726 [Oryza meyeriana var. granulata]
MPLHRRSLHRLRGHDCADWGGYGCSSPPSPPSVSFPPVPSPSPTPSSWPPAFHAPSPSPSIHGAAGGRRDQGGYHGYGSPPGGVGGGGGGDENRRRIITLIVVGTAALAFLSLILLGVTVAVRRRRLRRRQRQQALLAPAAATVNVEDGGHEDPEGGGGGGGGGVVHHIWYIRTVGLDEAAIDSIAATRYRAGAGLLGAVDCSVCLGEFQDGDLLRLLPKCGHVFHVPCIDTWLRAHVNCPLCRSDVLDPAATAAESGGGESSSIPRADPGANTIVAAEQEAAPGDAIFESQEGGEQEDQEAPHMEENRQEQSTSPDPLPLPLPRNVRRAASMDAAIVSTAVDVAALERLPEASSPEEEEEQSGRDKRGGALGASCLKVSSSGRLSNLSDAERPPRSFFSRHCRARSSVLPL